NRPLNDETFVITTTDTKKSTSDALASSINFGSKQPEKIMFMWTNLDELYRFANTPLFKIDFS
uniref:hypothetical protein n=1 Tax=Mycoplasmopsis bovis TaxID=28903 RepID=UPI003D2B08F9